VVYQEAPEREAGHKLLADLVDPSVQNRYFGNTLLVIQVHTAREKAQLGDLDGAIELVRTALDGLFAKAAAQWIALASSVLVESLLGAARRGSPRCTSIHRHLTAFPDRTRVCPGRCRLLLIAGIGGTGQGDDVTYRELRDSYRKMAAELGFEGHMAWAEAMP
jgi:adenylate cyclase